MRLALTGANGFIGRALTAAAGRAGVELVRLQRAPAADGHAVPWALGEPLPSAAADADVLVHLASATLGSSAPERALALDVEGSRLLIEALRRRRREGVPARLIFVSSQSADPQAINAYGRSKWAIEQLLTEPDEIIVRPGLVYGEPPTSVYAAMARLARLPVAPVVKGPAAIHPIQVDDLAQALLDIARAPRPSKLWRLGAAPGLTLAQMLARIAEAQGRRPPLFLTLPRPWVRLAARAVDLTLRPPQSMLERVDGLIGLKPMDATASLAELGRPLRPFAPGAE